MRYRLNYFPKGMLMCILNFINFPTCYDHISREYQIRPIVSGIPQQTSPNSWTIVSKSPPQYSFLYQKLTSCNKSTLIIDNPEHTLLVSMDAKSLYMTMPQKEGISSLFRYNHPTPFPSLITRKLLNFVLLNNYSTRHLLAYSCLLH